MDLYDVLNVAKSASSEDIRTGYLSQSRIHHPDKSSSSSTAAFRNINQAYTVLSDPALREFYDKHGYDAVVLAQDDLAARPDAQFSNELVCRDEKLKLLEKRVRSLLRASDELQAQRFLQPSGNITIGTRLLSYSPVYHSWSHSATTFGVALLSGSNSVSLFASSHVQRGGAAISRASIILGTALSPSITTRSIVHVMGGRWPSLELMIQKTVSEETVIRQTLAVEDVSSLALSTEWIQQLSKVLVGTIGVTVGASRGMSFELAKKIGGEILPFWRGKARLGLSSTGDISVSLKSKFKPVDGLELHVGPSLTAGNVSFEVAVQTELEPVVEEQEGGFPTVLTWSLSLGYPDEVTVGVKLTRGGFSFNFPIELPAVESRWALIGVLALWTVSPLIVTAGKKLAKQWSRKPEEAKPVVSNPESVEEAVAERRALESEAAERRSKEERINGLVIIEATYAGVDVTAVMMARVNNSSLSLSSHSKATLVGIRNSSGGHKLLIKYRYGDSLHERSFDDTEVVILP